MSVMVPPAGMSMAEDNTSTGATAAPAVEDGMVIEAMTVAAACTVPTWCMKSRQGIMAHSLYIMMRRET